MDVIKTLVAHQNVDENTFLAIKNGVKGCKSLLRSQDGLSQISSSCILAQAPAPATALEKDFTTNGTQGSLHCPFSKPNKMQNGSEARSGKHSVPKVQIEAACGHEHLDPIKAELDERRSSHTPSAPSSKGACPVSRCPIRFLDQHSPEEIAEYVERHKHEIPRSHAICVNRYQKNPQNMRHLDAKYGGLTSMIAGLGVKHQAFLPECQNGEGNSSSSASTQRVERWAENVDPTTPAQSSQDTQNEDDNRQSHFDRPLREVRVGESPSRPWGISVPVTHLPPASAPFNGSASGPISPDPQSDKSNNVDTSATPAKPTGCPFGHDKPKPVPSKPVLSKPEADAPQRVDGPENLPRAEETPAKPGCPFGHDKKAEGPKAETHPMKNWPREGVQDQTAEKTPAAQSASVSEDPTSKPGIPSTIRWPLRTFTSHPQSYHLPWEPLPPTSTAASLHSKLNANPPQSQAIRANGQIFVSGQIPADTSANLIEGNIGDKTQVCCDNIKAILTAAGSSVSKIVKVNVFLTDMANFAEMNATYEKFFVHKPARSCVAVHQLPKGVPVEIECIALE
ncbi:unnamed protein product [Penicillium salamii]|uniref:YjgF/Yer057p/UK114 family n=1 Tax=Penicillium salamii TaxID=1612424 RepID=A0A9W4J6M2_9EURO|nr:unnamed protein product [Penicillium salamii]CAG8375391.1 unnamed protein product [Penicillium salamii]CAG8375522.1 unnamed protein product [Penicillium salamii]CAG8415583.1 unnamed protein product [Penicillium salamii]